MLLDNTHVLSWHVRFLDVCTRQHQKHPTEVCARGCSTVNSAFVVVHGMNFLILLLRRKSLPGLQSVELMIVQHTEYQISPIFFS